MSSLRRRNGVPARGSETTKPGVSSTGQSLLKGNRDVRCIHFLVRKFSTGSLRLERRYCSQCCYVWRGRRLALDLHPCRHSRRRLGDCFPQALNDFCRTETGSPKGGPACAFGHAMQTAACFKGNPLSISTTASHEVWDVFRCSPERIHEPLTPEQAWAQREREMSLEQSEAEVNNSRLKSKALLSPAKAGST